MRIFGLITGNLIQYVPGEISCECHKISFSFFSLFNSKQWKTQKTSNNLYISYCVVHICINWILHLLYYKVVSNVGSFTQLKVSVLTIHLTLWFLLKCWIEAFLVLVFSLLLMRRQWLPLLRGEIYLVMMNSTTRSLCCVSASIHRPPCHFAVPTPLSEGWKVAHSLMYTGTFVYYRTRVT